jgi:glutamyl-tRNA reductase
VGALDGIALIDLETIRVHAPLVQWSAEEDARAVVDTAAHSYVTAASVGPAVVALREHVLGVVQAEIDRARLRGDDGRVEEALRHLTSVLLHTPSTLARRHAAAGRGDQVLAAVRTLYGLEVNVGAVVLADAGAEVEAEAEAVAVSGAAPQAETRSSAASRAKP